MTIINKSTNRTSFVAQHLRIHLPDFPGGPVDKSPPSIAGNMGLVPGQGTMIPHAVGQLLSPQARTTEPTCSGAHLPQPKVNKLNTDKKLEHSTFHQN